MENLARIAKLLRSCRGAFDLPSIITGAVVLGIVAVGILAAAFGAIPLAQNSAAKQDLDAVRVAEGASRTKDGQFVNADGLNSAEYLSLPTGLAVGANPSGSCWVGISLSGTGSAFYATDANVTPQEFTSSTDTGCLTSAEQRALVSSTGATIIWKQYAASWGWNQHGQLGNGSTANTLVPVSVTTSGVLAGKSVTDVSAGQHVTCALADGSPYCTGEGGFGQLGNGRTTNSSVPVAVSTSGVLAGKKVTAVSAGIMHTCAVADGAVYCWGGSMYGQLGNGSTANSSVPVAVSTSGVLAGKTVTAISAGDLHTCALADGAVYCWGFNEGRLGDGSYENSYVPLAVATSGVLAGKTVTAIDAGSTSSCTLADGAVYCWGLNANGQLGDGSTANSFVPVAVSTSGVLSGKTVTAVSAGTKTNCVVADGAAFCWGYNQSGELGIGNITGSIIPVAVSTSGVLAGKTVSTISITKSTTCAVAEGAAFCWGYNNNGQLGDNTSTLSTVPVAVSTAGVLAGATVKSISTNFYHTVVVYN